MNHPSFCRNCPFRMMAMNLKDVSRRGDCLTVAKRRDDYLTVA